MRIDDELLRQVVIKCLKVLKAENVLMVNDVVFEVKRVLTKLGEEGVESLDLADLVALTMLVIDDKLLDLVTTYIDGGTR